MDFGRAFRPFGYRTLAAAGFAGTLSATLSVATHPAAALALVASAQTAVTCAVTGAAACVSGTNTSSGVGVLGSSSKGYGVSGSSTSGIAGVIGTTKNSTGVDGVASAGGTGVGGTSATGTGVYGTTVSGNSVGVFGYETKNGTGVSAISGTGNGVMAYSNGGTASAVYGSNSNYGIGGYFQSGYEALVGESGEFPLILRNASGQAVFYVDSAGDVIYFGDMYQSVARARGAVARAFTAKMTSPTVEDTGTAQLVGGAAAVRLDPAFAASIDPRVAYRVFVTPDGDTPHGLFVAAKTAVGFIVREAQNGRSAVSFDYRVVATALGRANERMGTTTAVAAPPREIEPVAPAGSAIPAAPRR